MGLFSRVSNGVKVPVKKKKTKKKDKLRIWYCHGSMVNGSVLQSMMLQFPSSIKDGGVLLAERCEDVQPQKDDPVLCVMKVNVHLLLSDIT